MCDLECYHLVRARGTPDRRYEKKRTGRAHSATRMEALSDVAWTWGFVPPLVVDFFARGRRRARVYDANDFRRPLDGAPDDIVGEDQLGDEARQVRIRRFARMMVVGRHEAAVRGEEWLPPVESGWRQREYAVEDDLGRPQTREEADPTSVVGRERRCVHKIMDMLEKDLHACLPALEMLQRIDPHVDAFEAFVDDMERRFDSGTLPKRDELGIKLVNRWRLFVLSVLIAWIAASIGFVRFALATWRAIL